MIHNNILFHNVVDLDPAPGGGVYVRRFPEDVRNIMCPLGKLVAQESSGCELRFVTESESFCLALSCRANLLSPWESHAADVMVFKGAFFHSLHRLEAGKINYLQITDIGGANKNAFSNLKEEVRNSDYFHHNVWRVMLGRYTAIFHELDTYGAALRIPRVDEIPKKKILFYGSSITHGACPTVYHLCYVQQTARLLKADALNQGLSGSCYCEKEVADYLAERQDWDLICLELGVNMRNGFTPEEFKARSSYLVRRIVKAHPDKPVVLITIYPNGESVQNTGCAGDATKRQLEFDRILRELKAELGPAKIHLIEGSSVLKDYNGVAKDLIHPSDYGHMDMGYNLSMQLKAII